MLELAELSAGYGAVVALRDISIRLDAGQSMVIIGPNGAGKSTLLRTIAGAHRENDGEISFNGRSMKRVRLDKRHRLGMAWIPEGRGIALRLSVEDNLDMARFSGRWTATARTRTFDMFPALAKAKGRKAGTLSGGEQQMLAIARACETMPTLLLVDEPSLGLAPIVVSEIVNYLKDIRETGVSMLLVEQRSRGILELADRVALMRQAHLEEVSAADAEVAELGFESYLGLDVTSHGED